MAFYIIKMTRLKKKKEKKEKGYGYHSNKTKVYNSVTVCSTNLYILKTEWCCSENIHETTHSEILF